MPDGALASEQLISRHFMFVTSCTSRSDPRPAGLAEVDSPSDTVCWFALRVKPSHEKVASHLLEAKGYTAFLPHYRQEHQNDGRSREFDPVLFPGYLFCRFNVLTRSTVLTTPGVTDLVGTGSTPTPVDEREIRALQTAVLARLPIQPHPFVQTGARIQITRGLLAGVEGIVIDFQRSLRLALSITLLQRSVLVEIDRNLVRAGERST